MVVSAMCGAFADGKELTQALLLAEAKNTQPLSTLMAERVAQLRAWAAGRCVPAD